MPTLTSAIPCSFQDVIYYVDGEMRGQATEMTEFEEQQLQLGPGPHTIVFSYKYNPVGVDAFPPESPDRIGGVFLDDVYFLPEGVEAPVGPPTVVDSDTPAPSPISETPPPSPTMEEVTESVAPVCAPIWLFL